MSTEPNTSFASNYNDSTRFNNIILDETDDGRASWDLYSAGQHITDGWFVERGTVEVGVTSHYDYGSPVDGITQALELNGDDAGAISKQFTTIPGQQYTIRFSHNARTGSTSPFSVKVNDEVVDRFYSESSHMSETLTFTATSDTTKISFDSNQDGSIGSAIYDIALFDGDGSTA